MGRIDVETHRRLDKLRKTADAYGLKFEFDRGIARFIKTTGQGETTTHGGLRGSRREITYGIWAAETFLKGYIFASRVEVVPQERMGLWKDPDDEDPVSDTEFVDKWIGWDKE